MDDTVENDKSNRNDRKRKKSNLWLHKPKKYKRDVTFIKQNIWTPNNLQSVKPSEGELRKAPIKIKKKRNVKGKKKLVVPSTSEIIIKELIEIIPTVVCRLQKEGLLPDFVNLLRVIHENRFPLKNIAFLLLLEVARWYSLENTSQMFYTAECMKFWKVLYRLFHGKGLRFMSGTKSTGQILSNTSVTGKFDPKDTIINFAVPNARCISNFNSIEIELPRELPAGIITPAIDLKSTKNSYVLSVDGKKLAPGLNQNYGDQDLFGHEENQSLETLKRRINDEISEVEDVKLNWQQLPTNEQLKKIAKIVNLVSLRIKDLRILFLKQKLALRKFQKEAGEDWRSSRYVYAISSVQAMMFQIQVIVKRILEVNNSLLKVGSGLQSSLDVFVEGNHIDAFTQKNWITLKNPEDLPERYKEDMRFTKQRSDQWFEQRNKFKVTGSKIFEGIGLDTLKNLLKHFDKVNRNVDSVEEILDEVKQRMEHGTKSEIHAIATLVSKVLPFYYPTLKYIEEGSHVIHSGDKPLVLVSPDGSLGNVDMNSTVPTVANLACEFKCPVPGDYKTPVHYEIPQRYIPQILGEMASLNTQQLLYLSWTDESTTIFRAKFDANLWELIELEIKTLYDVANPKRPTRLSENVQNIKLRMQSYVNDFTEFLCEVPSMKGTCTSISQTNSESPYMFPISTAVDTATVTDVAVLFTETLSSLREAYQICRKKASEVLVWLLSDTDRSWNPEIPHSLPIAYAMKGYSLPTSPMRNMHNAILQACHDKDIHIVCSCFDGQWMKLGTRDTNDMPLTLLQLQRDVWESSRKTNRDTIITELSQKLITQSSNGINIDKNANGSLNVSCILLAKMQNCIVSYKFHSGKKRQVADSEEDSQTSDTTSYLPDVALETFLTDEIETDILNTLDHVDNRCVELEIEVSDMQPEDSSEVLNLSHTTSVSRLNDIDYQHILLSLQSHKKSSVANKWKEKDISILKKAITNTQNLKKMTHDEMNVIIDCTLQCQKKAGSFIRKSWRTVEKVNGISRLIGDGELIQSERKIKNMLSLKEFAARHIRSPNTQNNKRIPKDLLNLIHATLSYPVAYNNWLSKCPFDRNIAGIGPVEWFSYPEFNEFRQKLEPKCVDAHHLLVNLRSKVCKDGLKYVRKQAWIDVAEQNRDIISKSLVVDLIDKQNNAFAKRTFSKQVEQEMRSLNFDREADFCKLVREWYEAEDSPGLSSVERIARKIRLKTYLLDEVDFGQFPMYGMYVKGFPKVMFEGFLQRIDTTIQLYSIVKTGTFNHRSVSSLVNETFFGELSEMEPTRLGCPKAISIPRLMSTVTELFHYRCDPTERSFSINTTRKSVYPDVQLVDDLPEHNEVKPLVSDVSSCKTVVLRDHTFDKPERSRRKQRTTKRSDVSKPGEVARGCLPVRQHHKSDESKILPTTRLGIEMTDLNDL